MLAALRNMKIVIPLLIAPLHPTSKNHTLQRETSVASQMSSRTSLVPHTLHIENDEIYAYAKMTLSDIYGIAFCLSRDKKTACTAEG